MAPPADTVLEALIEHAAAFSSGDNERYAAGLSLPFVHLWPDGEILRYDDQRDVDLLLHYRRAGIDPATFRGSELDEAKLILDWEGLKAFHTKFTRHALDGGTLDQSEAIWVATRCAGAWKLKLRIGAARIR